MTTRCCADPEPEELTGVARPLVSRRDMGDDRIEANSCIEDGAILDELATVESGSIARNTRGVKWREDEKVLTSCEKSKARSLPFRLLEATRRPRLCGRVDAAKPKTTQSQEEGSIPAMTGWGSGMDNGLAKKRKSKKVSDCQRERERARTDWKTI